MSVGEDVLGKTRGILFDYNGVLVGDEHLQCKAIQQVAAAHGYHLSNEGYERECLGRTDAVGFKNLQKYDASLARVPVTQLVDEKVAAYQKITATESIVFPGVAELLVDLAKRYRIGVVTGSLRVESEPVLRESGIFELLDAFISAEDVARGKPYPDGYQKGSELLHLDSSAIVAVEDTPAGVRAAKAAGLSCIAITATVSASALHGADAIITATAELSSNLIDSLLPTI